MNETYELCVHPESCCVLRVLFSLRFDWLASCHRWEHVLSYGVPISRYIAICASVNTMIQHDEKELQA